MIAIVPGYISRSVAGSYDNEGIAIFCMLLTYYSWIKGIKSGSILWATITALTYFYMVSLYICTYKSWCGIWVIRHPHYIRALRNYEI